ncbi:Zn-dependent hydrolase [Methylopila sp. 73B]|uniref:Zn-dependent hydrolase n=1 Tax=Methylopila sp. 73B TaxID=1120792 RepID=UPI000363FD4F|nr:Zn-dependent hydrolase [Methylopila sp. 73B]
MTLITTPSRDDAAVDDFHRLFDAVAACGATVGGGVERQSASAADGAARRVFAAALEAAGATVRTDAVGNQYGVFALADRIDAPLVMLGSHLDSQPRGGRFDGALGVVAAAAVGAALMRAKRAGARFDADYCAVNWTNEEGARFRPSLLGSGFFTGKHDADFALSRADDAGVTLGEALAAIGQRGADAPPPLPACYLELHIEQGLHLESAAADIGVVRRNWGAIKVDVRFQGEQAHTGPCPMPLRRDALLAAAYLIAEARAIADRWPGVVHTSVGRIVVAPNSANVVPSEVALSLEIRSADDAVLAEAGALGARAIAEAAERANVTVTADRAERPIRQLPTEVCDLVAACAGALGLSCRDVDTVAGHDAISLLGLCPTGLIFVPSVGGVAHNEGEFTARADIENGLRLCLEAAWRLCQAGGSPERATLAGGPV